MKHFLFFIMLFFALILTGCGIQKIAPCRDVAVNREVIIKEIVRDTLIEVQPDSSILSALIECEENGRARIREIEQLRTSQRLKTSIDMVDDSNRLMIKTKVDSMGIYLLFKERHEQISQSLVETVTKVEIKEVNVLKWYQKSLMFCGIVFIMMIIGLVINFLRKIF